MSADVRTVATDALETLGMLIGEGEKRDAIHLAVEPVIATERCFPGQHVGLLSNGAASLFAETKLGIVDPFLTTPVEPGERFWLIVYPRQISSLRHVWEHPAFPTSGEVTQAPATAADPQARSRQWIEDFAAKIDQTYNSLMRAADRWVDGGDYTRDDDEGYKAHWEEFPEFWRHWKVVTGREMDGAAPESFFTCSC